MVKPVNGKIFREWRKMLGVSQDFFAKALGLSPGHLSRIEKSEIYVFRDEVYDRVQNVITELENIFNNSEQDERNKKEEAIKCLRLHAASHQKPSISVASFASTSLPDVFKVPRGAFTKGYVNTNITIEDLEMFQLLQLLHYTLSTYYTIQHDKKDDFIRYIQNYKNRL